LGKKSSESQGSGRAVAKKKFPGGGLRREERDVKGKKKLPKGNMGLTGKGRSAKNLGKPGKT